MSGQEWEYGFKETQQRDSQIQPSGFQQGTVWTHRCIKDIPDAVSCNHVVHHILEYNQKDMTPLAMFGFSSLFPGLLRTSASPQARVAFVVVLHVLVVSSF